MKTLIIGASGLLGKELLKDFSKSSETMGTYNDRPGPGLAHMDISDKEETRDGILSFRPEVIMLPASITGVDFCEQNRDLAWDVNVEGIKEVALIARKIGAFLVYYSTDFVFDGKNGPYAEEDATGPVNFYGKTKLEAEKVVCKELRDFLIIRTCNIYGYEKDGKNFVMFILDNLKNSKTIMAVRDQSLTPTYAPDLSGISLAAVSKKKTGIFHIAGVTYLSRVEFANMVADTFSLDKGLIREVDSKELRQPAERPMKAGLKTDKLKAELNIMPLSLKQGLVKMKRNMEAK